MTQEFRVKSCSLSDDDLDAEKAAEQFWLEE